MSEVYQHLLCETNEAGVRTITLNRPEKLNAVNMQLAEELPRALNEAGADDAVRVVVLTGAGRGFCAGLELAPENLKNMRDTRSKSRKERLDDLGWVGRWVLAVTGCEKPVIAAINGPAVGAGCGLTLACDIRVMSDAARIGTGYQKIGLCPDAGVSYFLPRLVGHSRASELIYSARELNAEEAERIGLVSRVLPADQFAAGVAQLANQLAAGPPIAQVMTKRLLLASLESGLTDQLRREISLIQHCLNSADLAESIQAFGEKRKPVFTGK